MTTDDAAGAPAWYQLPLRLPALSDHDETRVMRPFRVIAHRGDSASFPENTPAAFASAVRIGADEIECDVHVTRDGVPVIHHDANLRRTMGVDALVADVTAAEIALMEPVRARGGGPEVGVPTLADTLRTLASFPLQLELKEAAAVTATVQALRRHGDGDLYRRIVLTGFDRDFLLAARAIDRRLAVGWLLRDDDDIDPRECRRLGIAALMPHWRRLTPEIVASAHAQGLSVRAWGVKDLASADRAIAAGADGCTYDDPRELLAHLLATGRRPAVLPLPPLAQVGNVGAPEAT